MLMGRAPRRSVVSRCEFDSQPTTTWIETLECGHEYISYLLWSALGPIVPSATHRSCSDCKRVESVLLYLATAEIKEQDVWLRDDYRVAYKTVLNAAQGMSDPWIQAFCSYYGRHPKRAIPFWVERESRRAIEVGPGLSEFSPKKPVKSVRLPQTKTRRIA